MGRGGGATGVMKKLAQRRAKQLGIPVRKVGPMGIARESGLRVDMRGKAKPGFVVKIKPRQIRNIDYITGQPVYTKQAQHIVPDLNKALREMKNIDPKYLMKKPRNRK